MLKSSTLFLLPFFFACTTFMAFLFAAEFLPAVNSIFALLVIYYQKHSNKFLLLNWFSLTLY